MTKLTQSMVLDASRAACVALTDEDLAVMVRSLNRQLGQQAAAPGVRSGVMQDAQKFVDARQGAALTAMEFTCMRFARALLAVAPPPVGPDLIDLIQKCRDALDWYYEHEDLVARCDEALSTPPVRGGK